MLNGPDLEALDVFAADEPTGAEVVEWLARRGVLLNAEALYVEARLAGAASQFAAKAALCAAADHMADKPT